MSYANSNGADQPALPTVLNSNFCGLSGLPVKTNMSHDARKSLFRVSNQVRTATDNGERLEISDLGSRGIVLSG